EATLGRNPSDGRFLIGGLDVTGFLLAGRFERHVGERGQRLEALPLADAQNFLRSGFSGLNEEAAIAEEGPHTLGDGVILDYARGGALDRHVLDRLIHEQQLINALAALESGAGAFVAT